MRGGEPGVEEKPGETCGEAPDRGRLADSGTLLAPHTLGPFFSSELSVSRDIKDFFIFIFLNLDARSAGGILDWCSAFEPARSVFPAVSTIAARDSGERIHFHALKGCAIVTGCSASLNFGLTHSSQNFPDLSVHRALGDARLPRLSTHTKPVFAWSPTVDSYTTYLGFTYHGDLIGEYRPWK